MADDPWTQRFQNIDKLMSQQPDSAPASTPPATAPPATPAGVSPSAQPGHLDPIAAAVHRWLGLPTPDAAPMPAPGSDAATQRDTATAAAGGMYNVGQNIWRNLGGTPNPLPADAQTAMKQHPYAADVGSTIAGTAVALPVAAVSEVAAPFVAPFLGTGLAADVGLGAATGAAQNALAGNPDESLARRAVTGGVLGGALGGVANKVGGWFGAGRSIEQDVADAAKNAQSEGVTDIKLENLPGGNIKAKGATPTYEQSGQIDSATSKIVGDNIPGFKPTTDFKPASLNDMKTQIGGAATKAAQSGQVNVAPGGAVDQALTQVERFANANNAGASITPLIKQIRARIQNGVISGQDFDNLVGAGSPLHDLVGDDNPFVKQAAQALDKVMDTGFQASSPPGAYDAWVGARTAYRMLMGVEKAVLPNGHVDPTALFNRVLSRFTDMKGVPITSDPLVGRMGQFASSIRTLFGGGPAPQGGGGLGFWPSLAAHVGVGGAPAIISGITSGDPLNPENYLTPQALAGILFGAGTFAGPRLGARYQQSQPYANALISAGGAPVPNPLSQYLPAIGTQAFPQRQP